MLPKIRVSTKLRLGFFLSSILFLFSIKGAGAQILFDSFGPSETFDSGSSIPIFSSQEVYQGAPIYVAQALAVEFTPAVTSKLVSVELPLEMNGTPVSNFSLELVATALSASPTGSVLATFSGTAFSSVGSSPAIYTFSPTQNVTVNAGTSYSLLLQPDDSESPTSLLWFSEPATGNVPEIDAVGYSISSFPNENYFTYLAETPTQGLALMVIGTPEPQAWTLLLSALAIAFPFCHRFLPQSKLHR